MSRLPAYAFLLTTLFSLSKAMPPFQPVYEYAIYEDRNGDLIPDKVIKRTIGRNPPPGTENLIPDEVYYGIRNSKGITYYIPARLWHPILRFIIDLPED